MRNQQLTPDQLRLVQDQISAFRPQSSSTSYAAPHAPSAPSHNSSAAISTPLAAAPVAPVAATPTPPQQPVSQSLQNLLNSRTLAELIKNTAIRQQPTPPPAMPQMPQLPQVPPPMPSTGSSTPLPDNPLIAALRSRGILPPASAPPTMGQPPAGKGEALPFLIPGGMRSTPSAPTPISMAASSVVPMTTASMKMYLTSPSPGRLALTGSMNRFANFFGFHSRLAVLVLLSWCLFTRLNRIAVVPVDAVSRPTRKAKKRKLVTWTGILRRISACRRLRNALRLAAGTLMNGYVSRGGVSVRCGLSRLFQASLY